MNDITHDSEDAAPGRSREARRRQGRARAARHRAGVRRTLLRPGRSRGPAGARSRPTSTARRLSHWNFARKREPGSARVRVFNPDDRGARLAVDAHDRRDRQRRHAVPRRLGDDGGESSRPDAAPDHASDHRASSARRTARLTGLAADGSPTRDARVVHPRRGRPRDRRRLRSRRSPPTSRACSTTCARRSTTGRRWRAKAREIAARGRREPPPLPADETRGGRGVPRLARRQPLHVPRLSLPRPRHEGRAGRAADRRRDRASASCAEPRPRTSRRASPRCRRRSGPTRGGPSCWSSPSRRRARPCIGRAISTTSRSSASTRGARSAARIASSACSRRPPTAPIRREIPLLRRKIGNVSAARDLPPGSHADKALLNILATYPRDELFQIAEDDLLRTAIGILHLGDRQRFRLFVRRDPFERFLSCLIYAPRENYTTELRQKWQAILMEAFNGIELRVQRPPVGVDARAHPDHRAHDARPRSRASTCASSRRGSPRRAALGRRPQGRRWSRRSARRAATSSRVATATRFPRLPRGLRRARRGPRHRR